VGKGDTELAVRLAQAAIVADPARPRSYVALGDIYAEAGQPDYARSFYDQALGIDPADADALKALTTLNHDHPEHTARATQ
jgi:Tfp pilus assembly protein PilF